MRASKRRSPSSRKQLTDPIRCRPPLVTDARASLSCSGQVSEPDSSVPSIACYPFPGGSLYVECDYWEQYVTVFSDAHCQTEAGYLDVEINTCDTDNSIS